MNLKIRPIIIGFIGAGKMAEALIARLGRSVKVMASDVNRNRLNFLQRRYRIKIARDKREVFTSAQVVVLAVKPQNVAEVSEGIRNSKLVISIAAGIPLSYLQKKLPGFSIIRAMPNNPALVGCGITALAKSKPVTSNQFTAAKKIFGSVGEVIEVPEKWMDAVTGLSGSGPAFVYEVIEALTAGGVASGLPKSVAAKLALQTVAGAAATVKQTGKTPRQLRKMVASPGGTTIEGLKVLEKYKFKKALVSAVVAATKRSKALTRLR